jgi:DNA-binding PadR family transcriptional regulator
VTTVLLLLLLLLLYYYTYYIINEITNKLFPTTNSSVVYKWLKVLLMEYAISTELLEHA